LILALAIGRGAFRGATVVTLAAMAAMAAVMLLLLP